MRIWSWVLIAFCLTARLAAVDCVEVSQRDAFRLAFTVFRGTVAQVQNMDPRDPSAPMLVTFKVDRGWKGPVRESMRVFVFGAVSFVDTHDFRESERYVVYATNDAHKWGFSPKASIGSPVYAISNPCLLRVRTDVEQESRKLGRGHLPKPDPRRDRAPPTHQQREYQN
jgi:hypothetical protein